MDRIKNIDRIFQVAKSEISKKAEQNPGSVKSVKKNVQKKEGHSENLRKQIIKRMEKLDPKDDDFIEKGRRVFLESTLEWEFGEYLNNTNYFNDVISNIEVAIKSDDETDSKMNALIRQLVKK